MLVTSDWVKLDQDQFYRKKELYTLPWSSDLDLKDCNVAASNFGGPIVVWRKQVINSGKQIILIFRSCGTLISSVKWTSGSLLTCGWSNKEELLCIQDDGLVHVYNIHGELLRTIGFGKDAKDSKLVSAKVYNSLQGTGIVVLTSLSRFYAMTNIEAGSLKRLPDVPGMSSAPSCWFPFTDEENKKNRVFVANGRDVFVLDLSETSTFQQYPDLDGTGKIIAGAASGSGRSIAMATEDGSLWIGSADFRDKHSEVKMTGRAVSSLAWCGGSSVVCAVGESIALVSVTGLSTTYYYQSSPFLVQEMDCVRIFNNETHDMIQRVPAVTVAIFGIGSMEPGGILFDASKLYQERSYRCEEYIQLTRNHLTQAVNQCIEAAGHEFDPTLQKSLLQAAKLGKGFVENYHPDAFVDIAKTLRILNAVRSEAVGIPLTIEQLKSLSIPVLLDRLVLRHHFQLALEIAKYLRLPEVEGVTRILTHWACFKMKEIGCDPEVVAREIANKIRDVPGISPGDIAAKAMKLSRKGSAVKDSSFLVYAKLLDYELNSRKQVRMLLKMGQENVSTSMDIDKAALARALESGDGDLIAEVLLYLKSKMNKGELFRMIHQYPVALTMLIQIMREKSPSVLTDIYEQEDDFNQQALLYLAEGCRKDQPIVNRLASVLAARDCAKKGRNEENALLCDDAHRLLKQQAELEQKLKLPMIGLSLCDTLRNLWSRGEGKQADEMARIFRLSEKRLWWLKVQCLSDLGEWSELEKLSRSKKSPIGYEPFVDACLKSGNRDECIKYLPKVKEENKIDYFLKAELYEDVIQLAYERRDGELLLYVQSLVSSSRHLVDKINALKTQLDSRR